MNARRWLPILVETKGVVFLIAAIVSGAATQLLWIVLVGFAGYALIVCWNIHEQTLPRLAPEYVTRVAEVQALHRRVLEEATRLPLLNASCVDAFSRVDLTRHASRLALRMQNIDAHVPFAQTEELRRMLADERHDLEAQWQQMRAMLEKMLGQLTQLQSRVADDTAHGLREVSAELAAYVEVLGSV